MRIALVALALAASPELPQGKAAALGGISAFSLGVQGVDAEALAAGVEPEALQAQAERVLRRAGVPVLHRGDPVPAPGVRGNLTLSVWITGSDPHGAVLVSAYRELKVDGGGWASVPVWQYVQVLSPRKAIEEATWQEEIEKPLAAFAAAYREARAAWLAALPPGAVAGHPEVVRTVGAPFPSCAGLQQLRRGMSGAEVTAALGDIHEAVPAVCSDGADGDPQPCALLTYVCDLPRLGVRPVQVVLGDDRLRSWSILVNARR